MPSPEPSFSEPKLDARPDQVSPAGPAATGERTADSPTTPSAPCRSVEPDKVIQDEREIIARRRDVAFPQEKSHWEANEVAGDLVGLALSGGGIRSAMFNLGLLQALHRTGLLRYVDYLSTVSGGSYIGAHFSSLMLKLREDSGISPPPPLGEQAPLPPKDRLGLLEKQFELREERHRPQEERVLRFIRTGSYLNRPWEFVLSYVGGLILNLMVFLSGMVFVCALLALLWRLCDYDWLRYLLTWGNNASSDWQRWVTVFTPDLVRVFIPTFLCWAAYGIVRLHNSRVQRQSGKEPRLGLQSFLQVCAWLSLLVALVVLLGNGDTSVGIFRHLVPQHWMTYDHNLGEPACVDPELLPASVRVSLLALLSAANLAIVVKSVPLILLPRKAPLATAGGPGGGLLVGQLGPALARVGLAAVLCAVPILVLFFLARENVSGKAPLGKIIRVTPSRVIEGNVTAIRLSTAVGNRGPLDPELSRIKITFKDVPEGVVGFLEEQPLLLSSADDEKKRVFWRLVSPWHDEESQAQTDPVSLQVEVWDPERKEVVLKPAEGTPSGRLPAGLDEGFWVEMNLPPVPGDLEKEVRGEPITSGRITGIGATRRPDIRRSARRDGNSLTLLQHDQRTRLFYLGVSGLVFLFTGFAVSFNRTSLHGFYRDRLEEAYIDRSKKRGEKKVQLTELDVSAVGAPYHLICTTLTLIGKNHSPERTCPFVFSAHYFGSAITRFWPTKEGLSGFDDLAEVTALSGAALTPVQVSSAPLAVLMTALNLRLGQWLPNPNCPPRYSWSYPCAIGLLLDFRHDAEDRHRLFLSDGGHDENLGLWPLVLRRCKLIIVSDASEDAEHSLEDFLRLCRRLRLQAGVEFVDLHDSGKPIDLTAIQLSTADRTSKYHYFVGRIAYPQDGSASPRALEYGYLIYVKPSITADEDPDLRRHFKFRTPFPHDPTIDQMYDNDTVESYRQLGSHIGNILGQRFDPPEKMWDTTSGKRHTIEALKDFLVQGLADEATSQPLLGARVTTGHPSLPPPPAWAPVGVGAYPGVIALVPGAGDGLAVWGPPAVAPAGAMTRTPDGEPPAAPAASPPHLENDLEAIEVILRRHLRGEEDVQNVLAGVVEIIEKARPDIAAPRADRPMSEQGPHVLETEKGLVPPNG